MPALPGVPRTWVAGEYPSAAQMNTELKDSLNFLANPPACKVQHTLTQSIPHNTATVLAFNSELYKTAGYAAMHDNTTNNSRITIVTPGIYHLTANVRWQSHASAATRLSRILLNGASGVAEVLHDGPTGAIGQLLSASHKLAAGDYIQVQVYQFTAATINVETASLWSPTFSAVWVGKG